MLSPPKFLPPELVSVIDLFLRNTREQTIHVIEDIIPDLFDQHDIDVFKLCVSRLKLMTDQEFRMFFHPNPSPKASRRR